MKKLVLLLGILVSLTAFHVVMAQTGVINYEVKVNMHRNIPAERESMKAMIPEFRTSKQQLFFDESQSLYKTVIEDEEEQFTASSGGMRMTFRMPNVELYTQTSGKILSKQELMGKNYLIIDSVQMAPWKFGDQVKTIAGYECRMAYYSRTDTVPARTMIVMGNGAPPSTEKPETTVRTTEITAWFTDKIRPSLGPERYNTLPGTVLAIDVNNGERVIVAKSVEVRALKKNELKEPSGGTQITQAEFRKLMEEQMKQMGGRGMTIRN